MGYLVLRIQNYHLGRYTAGYLVLHIQNYHLGRYSVGYLVLRQHISIT